MCVIACVVADITEALNGVSGTLHIFAQFFQSLDGSEVHAVTGSLSTRQRAAELNRFAGKYARCRMFHHVFIGINHPRHDFAVGVHIRCGNIDFLANQRRNGFGISACDTFQFRFGIIARIQGNAAFATAVRNTGHAAFDGHPNRQCFDFVQIHTRMEAHAAFVGTDGVVVLRTVTGKGFNRAIVEFNRKGNFQNALRTFQDFINSRVGFQLVTGSFHLFAGDFKRIEGFFYSSMRHFASFHKKIFSHHSYNYNQFPNKM